MVEYWVAGRVGEKVEQWAGGMVDMMVGDMVDLSAALTADGKVLVKDEKMVDLSADGKVEKMVVLLAVEWAWCLVDLKVCGLADRRVGATVGGSGICLECGMVASMTAEMLVALKVVWLVAGWVDW